MNDDSPTEVAWHFGIATALSVSLCAAPFVPEAILAYAGYRFLRHFTYGWRNWRAPGRVPHHLGRRGYRDETTRRRGDATWPIGLAKTGQVWLRRVDLVQGMAIEGDDPLLQARAIGNLVFAACMNGMGAIIVEGIPQPVARDKADPDDGKAAKKSEMLTRQISQIARPFGRDTEVYSIDLDAVPQPPLRVTASTLTAAIADMRLGPEAEALHAELLPLAMAIATRREKNPFEIYAAFLDEVALNRLIEGRYEIEGHEVAAYEDASAEGAALRKAIKPIQNLPNDKREVGRKALAAHAAEIAGLNSVSLTEGFELRSAISTRGIFCIRPSSPLTAALVIARCIEALVEGGPGHAADNLIHVVYPAELSGKSARRFRAAAVQAGAIGTLSLPARPPAHIYQAVRKITALRIQGRTGSRNGSDEDAKIISTMKDCPFTLDIEMPA